MIEVEEAQEDMNNKNNPEISNEEKVNIMNY